MNKIKNITSWFQGHLNVHFESTPNFIVSYHGNKISLQDQLFIDPYLQ